MYLDQNDSWISQIKAKIMIIELSFAYYWMNYFS